jgi:hypothetical protein
MAFPAALRAEEKDPVKHRFLMYDESRGLLHYVDQRDSSKDWKLELPRAIRDFQPIGDHRLMIAQPFGYSVYDLQTRKSVEDVRVPDLGDGMSARRRADGATVIGANYKGGVQVVELDKENKVARRMTVPEAKNLRMIRLASDGHVLLAEQKGLIEVAFDAAAPNGGKIVQSLPLPRGANAFMALKRDDGSVLLSGGYAHAVFEFGPDGKLRKEFEVKDGPKGVDFHFFAGIQVLKNGNIVACNWTGHDAKDSTKGWQLVEFAPDGTVVWHWHDAERAGTAINIAILDDLDENKFLDDASGTLK